MPNHFDRGPGGPGGFGGPCGPEFGGPRPPHRPPYGYRRGGFGLGSILLAGAAAAAAGALIGKASQNQTQNTTRKTKDVTNDDDGFVW